MDLTFWMRRFTIRTRMLGAIAIVLGMFAVVGITGFLGGQRLKSLNSEFMEHSVKELTQVALIRNALADVRLLEKEMVINYEDGIAVLKARESWQAAINRTKDGLLALLQGEEDEDNALAREAAELMDAYNKASLPVLAQIQDGGLTPPKWRTACWAAPNPI